MKKIFNTTVSVKEAASRSVLRGIVQYDTLNEVNIRLSDGSKAFNYDGYTNIIFKVLKADGTSYIDSEGANVIATSPEDGVVTVILCGQATTAAGLCQSVIEVYADGEKMTTARLNYEVFESLDVDEDAIMSEPEYSVLQNLVSDVSALESLIEAAEAARASAEEERVVAELARKEAEIKREDEETGYVAQAAKHANDAMNAARNADNDAQQTSVDRAIVDQMRVETRGYSADASASAREAAASAVEAKASETVVLEAKASAQQSAAAAKASETKAATAAAQAAEDAATVMGNIASAVESAESAEYNEMLAERWASTAKGWSEGGQVVTNVRLDSEGRTVFTVADAYGAKQYAADAKASAESIGQYETDLGAAVQSAQASATEAKAAEASAVVAKDGAVAAQSAAEKARDEAQAIAGGDFANTAYVDSEIWDHNYSTSAHGDIRGRIYNVEQKKPMIVTVTKNDGGVYVADQYMEDIVRARNNGRLVMAVIETHGVSDDNGDPVNYDLYYLTDCDIVNTAVANFTINELRFRNANGGEILITNDDTVEVREHVGAAASISATIPKGRMRGDMNGDGVIDQADVDILTNQEALKGNWNAVETWCADTDANGIVNAMDVVKVRLYLGTGTVFAGMGDYYGNWTYSADTAMWYADIPVSGMTVTSDAIIVAEGEHTSDAFTAECVDGAVRIYAKNCPVEEIPCMIMWSASGSGIATVIPEKTPAITAESVGAKPAGESDVFIAEYDVTTNAEIEEAYQAGRAVFVKKGDYICALTRRDSNDMHWFSRPDADAFTVYACVMGTWMEQSSGYGLTIASSSGKKFKLSVDDNGTLTTVEV